MKHPTDLPFVTTIPERCRVCYTCVRECPAKAIRIAEGRAMILGERCIACGNCVRVCSQRAKQVIDTTPEVEQLLASGAPVAACLAPSFPAEFAGLEHTRVVGMLRKLGFALVTEVAFGADLVARAYANLLKNADWRPESVTRASGLFRVVPDSATRRYIATTCPAAVGYIERYYPHLVNVLAPIVSPMEAMARALRCLHPDSGDTMPNSGDTIPDSGDMTRFPAVWKSGSCSRNPEIGSCPRNLKIVFIGPCIAKKAEASSSVLDSAVDAVITFAELRRLLERHGVVAEAVQPSEFDPPHPSRGALFSIKRGMLQAAGLSEDPLAGAVIAAHGRTDFVHAIDEFESGQLDARFLELLCCNGCIMGAGMSQQAPMFKRRAQVAQYVRQRLAGLDRAAWQQAMDRFAGLDLSRRYSANDQRVPPPSKADLMRILGLLGKSKPEDELNCGACGYDTCLEHAVAIHKGLAGNEMCLPYTIEKLHETIKEVARSKKQLEDTREALVHSEKLASMGQLAAGVAHEINNPLGVVLMYAHLLLEQSDQRSRFYQDLSMIAGQADRCKKIVSQLLNFARQNKALYQNADLRNLVALSLQSMPPPENVCATVRHEGDTQCEVDPDQIVQVFNNLLDNAYAAMPNGGDLTICTRGDGTAVVLSVSDTGIGIAPENLGRIFEPFFTTKQIGMGTGLGLSVTYGIVKLHRGDIAVKSNSDPAAGPTGTTFTATLPRRPNLEEDRRQEAVIGAEAGGANERSA